MEPSGAELTEFIFFKVLPIGLVCFVIVLCYLSVLAYIHLRARYCYEFYLRLGVEVKEMRRKREEDGEDMESLESWEEVRNLLRMVLEEEHVIKKEKVKSEEG